jgi:deferrochelatase/peroxidase EfeB
VSFSYAEGDPARTMVRPRPGPPDGGPHQPGIATRQQAHLALVALDAALGSPEELRALLTEWSGAGRALMAGELRAAGLTVTIGLGPALFAPGRLGLERRRPVALEELPAFAGDALEPRWCGGDLCLQVCADDAGAVAAARDELVARARGAATVRWVQDGFLDRGRARGAASPRNPLGFRDGTVNLRRPADLGRHVWAGRQERTWMAGGTYLVFRRIRLDTAAWADLGEAEQERVIGRRKASGAPLGGRLEYDPRRLDASLGGEPAIPAGAHVRQAAAATNGGAAMLRRSYSYAEGEESARAEAGIAFLCYQRDPRRQFAVMQRRLAAHDALSAFARHTGSAVFALPPGMRDGGYVGEGLV